MIENNVGCKDQSYFRMVQKKFFFGVLNFNLTYRG